MPTIICTSNSGNKGKSETLRQLGFLLTGLSSVPPVFGTVPPHGDFRLVLSIRGKVIAIESQGDTNTNLKSRLLDIHATYNPDILFCAARTRGETVDVVNYISRTFTYDLIWTSTYEQNNPANHLPLNTLKAKQLHELIVTLGLI